MKHIHLVHICIYVKIIIGNVSEYILQNYLIFMILEHLKNLKVSIPFILAGSFIALFIDPAFANGLILGTIAQVIYLALLSRSITGILETKSNGFLAMMSMIFDLLVIVIVLLAGFLFKDNINYWGIFIGLVFDKVIYLILNLRR